MEFSELCFILMRNILFYSLHISYSLETSRKSSVTRFPSVCFKFLKNTSTFLGVVDLFVPEIWSFITFYGGFSIIASKLMKPHASFFQDCSLIRPSILMPNFLFISRMLLKILSITAVPKTRYRGNVLNFTLFWCAIFYFNWLKW